MSYIIVATPPHVENPLTEEDPIRFTAGSMDNIEELIAGGAPTVTRPATIEAVPITDGGVVPYELLKEHIGGYIEVAYRLPLDAAGKRGTIDFFCDEEGLLKKLTPIMVRPSDGWILRGPIVVCFGTTDGESLGLEDRYFNGLWNMFSLLGFVDVKRMADVEA